LAKLDLPGLAEKMARIDFAMLMTRDEAGRLEGRPMSNNRDVDFDGDSWFFSDGDTRKVAAIQRDASVALAMQGSKGLLGSPGIMISIDGEARLIEDKAMFADHWNPDLERWFAQGIDTPGLVLIQVRARRILYWDGEDEGEITR